MNQQDALKYTNVKFPKINKNNTLEENDEMIKEGSYQKHCEIKKTLIVPASVYHALGNTLLHENDIWESIGGSECIDNRYDDYTFIEALKKWAQDENPEVWITGVVLIINAETNEKFYVNTEGFKYARYVG